MAGLLRWAQRHLAADDVAVMDAGVKLADVLPAGLERYLLRLATNFTARHNRPLPHCGKGRRLLYGEKIRPLERSYKGKTIAASSPDRVETWTEDGVGMRAEIWQDLILPGVIPAPQAKTFRVYAIYDPAYATPWLLATPLHLKAATVKAMYHDRWPVEQIPLSAKQMVGAHRLPSRSRIIKPVNSITIPSARTAKERRPMIDGPKSDNATRARKGVTGGQATYPQAK